MNIEKLYEYKEKYEKELIFAEAKVAVITDMIAVAEAEKVAEESEVETTDDYIETSTPTIY